MLQCVAVCCSVLQCVAVCCSVLQCVAVCYSALQCVAVCCSMLQCVAVCCRVLQCFYRLKGHTCMIRLAVFERKAMLLFCHGQHSGAHCFVLSCQLMKCVEKLLFCYSQSVSFPYQICHVCIRVHERENESVCVCGRACV